MRKKKFSLFGIPRYCCYAGGSADPQPETDPSKPEDTPENPEPESKPAKPAVKPPVKPAKPDKAETSFTAEQLETEKQKAASDAVEAYKKHLEDAEDFEKMTAEEKVVYLQRQMADEKLAGYAAKQLSATDLPVEFAAFVKGADEKDTDEKIKTLKAAYDKGVQAGVEQRFKANGYVPRKAAAGQPGDEGKKRPHGVSVK